MLSRNHALAQRLRLLRRDAAARAAEGVFVAEGIHLALEALEAGAPIELAVVSPRLQTTPEGREVQGRLTAGEVPVHEAGDATLDALQDSRSPQPVILVVRRTAVSLDAVLAGRGGVPLLVIVWGVQDPGNLGGIVRSADAAGATGLIATGGSADLFHPRAVRGTMGSIFRLPVTDAAAGDILSRVAAAGMAVIGALPRGGTPYDAIDWRAPSALFLGGEGAGLPPELSARLDLRVGVPMREGVESLSVAAAAAVLLFEAARARRPRT